MTMFGGGDSVRLLGAAIVYLFHQAESPEADGVIFSGGDKVAMVWGEGEGDDSAGLFGGAVEFGPGGDIPETDGVVGKAARG